MRMLLLRQKDAMQRWGCSEAVCCWSREGGAGRTLLLKLEDAMQRWWSSEDVVVEAGRLTCRDGGAVLLLKLKEARQRWSRGMLFLGLKDDMQRGGAVWALW